MPSADIIGLFAIAVVTAIGNLGTAYFGWRAHQTAQTNAVNIQKIETATNSMKDALVAATGQAQYSAGREQGRLEGADKRTE